MKALVTLFFASLLIGQLPSLFPVTPVPVYVHDFLLALLVLAVGAKILISGKFKKPSLLKPILAFAGAGLLSIILNAFRFNPDQLAISSLYLLRWFGYAFLYLAVVQQPVTPRFWLKGLFWTGTAFAAGGLIQFVYYPSLNLRYLGWDPYYYRLFSTLFDPNFMGIILVLAIYLGLYLAKERKTIYYPAVCMNSLALFLTFSRSSFVALGAGLVLLGLLFKKWKPMAAFAVLIAIFLIMPKPQLESLNLLRRVSSEARLNNWKTSWRLFEKSPLYGWGFNTIKYLRSPATNDKAGAGIDNSYLFILDTTGIIGFSAYLWILFGIVRLRKNISNDKSFTMLYRISLMSILVHSAFTNTLFYPWTMVWMWIMTGTVEASSARK